MKQHIINQIKSELHMLEVSSLPHEFDKHLYAIEMLVDVLKEQKSAQGGEAEAKMEPDKGSLTDKDAKMLELMGGSKSAPARDEYKSDSIFDF